MDQSSVTVGVVAGRGPGDLDRTLRAVLFQLGEKDTILVALLAGFSAPEEAGSRIEEMNAGGITQTTVKLVGDPYRMNLPLSPSPAAARNSILGEARSSIIAFLDDSGIPRPGWLQSIRAAFENRSIEIVAGAVDQSPAGHEKGARPGGRLRWTGHIVADYSSQTPASTSLAPGGNFAIRRVNALKAGGFDEAFGRGWIYEEVEFFIRVGKTGARAQLIPGARVVQDHAPPPVFEYADQIAEALLERRGMESRSMAAIFSRHEAWALLLMVSSHLIQTALDIFASRLPTRSLVRIMREMIAGVKTGVRPVSGRIAESGSGGKI